MNKPNLRKRGYGRCKQGYYSCKNPKKYAGNINNIIFRSGLELSAFKFMDFNSNVKRWAAEIITIPYFDRLRNKKRTYYVDLYVEFINKNNDFVKNIIEIKPYKQTQPPNRRGKYYDKRLSEYTTNISKWEAAQNWAKSNGMEFKILTERELK